MIPLPFLLLLSLLAPCIEVDISIPGFPDMAQYFRVGEGMVQLTIAYNFLGLCLSSLLYGPLSESYGRRKIMLYGNGVMLLGAFGCVVASSMPSLIFFRFIQGLGASASTILVFVIIADVYEEKKAMNLVGMANAFVSISRVVARIVGCFINGMVGWRGNYGVVAGISAMIWLLLYSFLPETKENLEPFRGKKILEDYKRVFTNSLFLRSALAIGFLSAAHMAYVASSSFLYTHAFGLSRESFVLHQTVIVGSYSVMSALSGWIIQNFGIQKTVAIGMSLACGSTLFLVGMGLWGSTSALPITMILAIWWMGVAMSYPIIFMPILTAVPEAKGTASSALSSIRSLMIFGFMTFVSAIYRDELIRVAIPVALGVLAAAFLVRKKPSSFL